MALSNLLDLWAIESIRVKSCLDPRLRLFLDGDLASGSSEITVSRDSELSPLFELLSLLELVQL
jgi:hypothetical protein